MADELAASIASLKNRISPERAVATVLVILLHLVLVWLLLRATIIQITPKTLFEPKAITIWLKPAPEKKKPEPQKEKKVVTPAPVQKLFGPIVVPPSAPPPEQYNGLRSFGRYLNNCSAGNYEALSAKELAHCIGNKWTGPHGKSLRLGSEPSSPWKTQMEQKKKPSKPIEHECAQGSRNANLGLPCYDFSGQ